MIKQSFFVTVAACTMTLSLAAQRIKIIEGDLSPLKSETKINVEFTYDNMTVGKNLTESEYIAKKRDEYNAKEPGKGDNWAKSWVNDRKDRFEPKFLELFMRESEMTPNNGMKKDAKYTLIFKTVHTEPGFNIVMARKNAEIDGEAWIVDAATQKVVAKLSVERVPGRTFGGGDYDTGLRISECYADAGKALGKFIRKEK